MTQMNDVNMERMRQGKGPGEPPDEIREIELPIEVTDNEGMTHLEGVASIPDAPYEPVQAKPKRKSPERFGPVMAVDLERLRVLFDTSSDGWDEDALLSREIDRLILRAKIAEANTAKAARLAAKARR